MALFTSGQNSFSGERDTINDHIRQPSLADLGPGLVHRRIIRRRYSRGDSRAGNFRIVRRAATIIRARDQHPRERVGATLDKSAMTQCVVSAVLVQRNRKDTLHPQVLVRLVSKGVPEIAAIAGRALAKLRIRVLRLGYAGLPGGERNRRVVEALKRRSLELLLRGLRRQLLIRAHGTEIRNDAENTFGLLALIPIRLRSGLRLRCGGSARRRLRLRHWRIGQSRRGGRPGRWRVRRRHCKRRRQRAGAHEQCNCQMTLDVHIPDQIPPQHTWVQKIAPCLT